MSNAVIGEVLAERIGLRVRLYRLADRTYALRFSGLGWHVQRWRDPAAAWVALLNCASYGPDELAMLRRSGTRENP